MTLVLPRSLSIVCLLFLASMGRAEQQIAPIHDDAKLFHAGAIDRAAQGIADIRQTFDRNVFVNTVASASPKQGGWFPFLRTPQVNRMLEEQARKIADESGAPGIYVVIFARPRAVHVVVRPKDDQENDPEFTRRDAEALRRMLARSLHDQGGDAALLALVEQVHTVLQDHATRGSSSASSDAVFACLLGGGLGLWLLLRMVRFKMRTRAAEATWQTGSVRDPNTQAREKAALFGALFGFPAGMWIYDKLYPCPPGATPLCEPPAEPAVEAEEENREKVEGEHQPLPEHTEDASVSP